MKFEDLLMQPREDQQRRIALEEEVVELQERLNRELRLNSMLRCALRGPALPCHCLSLQLPFQVQVLLAELAMVEEEIVWLERRVEKLKLRLYQEKQVNKEWENQHRNKHQQKLLLSCTQQSQAELEYFQSFPASLDHKILNKQKVSEERRMSLSSVASDMHSLSSTRSNEEIEKAPQRSVRSGQSHDSLDVEIGTETPNRLSEELLNCLIGIFLKMNHSSLENEATSATKHTLSCISSSGFTPKTTFNSKARSSYSNDNTVNLGHHGMSQDYDGNSRDAGPYKNFIQITRNSLNTTRSFECSPATRKLRILLQQLCNVDLTHLTYKQKLAFWINVYNCCVMNAYLQHGLPSSQERMVEQLNKAALNVGGIVLNALAIEHYILRHPGDSNHDHTDENKMLLRDAYGLRYPEPNITFALSRGNWSSPALKVYTPDEVVHELEKAKVEYLEASVGVTAKKKILVPKLLRWHMQDFADDLESLIEWIYSQLSSSGLLKRRVMECLKGEAKLPIQKMVEIVPYEYEFRYLLPEIVRAKA